MPDMLFENVNKGVISSVEAYLRVRTILNGDTVESRPFAYYPYAKLNPFQRLLYCKCSDFGYNTIPLSKTDNIGVVNGGGDSIIHLHWLSDVLSDIHSPHIARNRVDLFGDLLRQWKGRGHFLIWTMHNLLPHRTLIPDAEVELRKVLVNECDAVHVMSRCSVSYGKDMFGLDERKVFYTPHPTYEGWYPNFVGKSQARLELGLDDDDFIFLFFGSIQQYKGISDLVDSFCRLKLSTRQFSNVKLLIVGKPVDSDYANSIQEMSGVCPDIIVTYDVVEDRDVQYYFQASDFVVLPYVNTLNSGLAHLAITFERPVVCPRMNGLLEVFDDSTAVFYDGTTDDGLSNALASATEYSISLENLKAKKYDYNPVAVSSLFFESLESRV